MTTTLIHPVSTFRNTFHTLVMGGQWTHSL